MGYLTQSSTGEPSTVGETNGPTPRLKSSKVCILAGALVFKANQESGGKALGSGVLKGLVNGENAGENAGENGGEKCVFFLKGCLFSFFSTQDAGWF